MRRLTALSVGSSYLRSAPSRSIRPLPTIQGDPEEYHVGGAWFAAHQAKHPTAESHNYLNVNHGFLPRGDAKDAETQEACHSAVERTFKFIAAHM